MTDQPKEKSPLVQQDLGRPSELTAAQCMLAASMHFATAFTAFSIVDGFHFPGLPEPFSLDATSQLICALPSLKVTGEMFEQAVQYKRAELGVIREAFTIGSIYAPMGEEDIARAIEHIDRTSALFDVLVETIEAVRLEAAFNSETFIPDEDQDQD